MDCQARRLAKATLTFYRAKLRLFGSYCAEQRIEPLEELQSSDIKRYLLALTDRGCNTVTVHVHARAIRTFLNYCVRDELLTDNPFDRVKMPTVDREPKDALSETELRAVLKAAQGEVRDTAIVLFILDTGARSAETRAINIGDLNMGDRCVLLRHTKSRQQRTCYLAAKTIRALRKYLSSRRDAKPHDPLFLGRPGRLSSAGLEHLMNRLSDASGVHVTAHTLRRTCAITMLRNGASIYHVQRQLGHRGIEVLKWYLPLVEDDLKDAHAKYGPVDHL